MSTEQTNPPARRSGPHAPLPASSAPPAAPDPIPEVSAGRPESPREEDPRTRAARRALELREHMGPMDQGEDKFYIDPRIVPDGWSYEWKAFEILGKPNPSYQVALANRGWEAVPASRHPELMPVGWTGPTIVKEGQMLMERPKEITDEVRQADQRTAREQVRGKEAQLGATPPGTFERDADPRTRPVIKKSYESTPIPEK